MKKIIIFSVLILSIGLTGIFSLDTTTEKSKLESKNSGIEKIKENKGNTDVTKEVIKRKEKINQNESSREEKELYSNSIPVVNQEYTIDYNDNIQKVSEEKEIEEVALNDDIKVTTNFNEEEETEDEVVMIAEEVVEEKEENNESLISKEDEESSNIEEDSKDINEENNSITNEQNNIKNGFYEENNATYYYENGVKITGLKNINGVNNYFSPSGKYLGTNNIKVIDVSYYQGDINWDLFAKESDCYGVILRLGYYQTLDKKFERNISELKRLNIPYGIYLFSYSTTLSGAKKEADFTNNMISKYELNPTLGIYYDIESWSSSNGSSSNEISKDMYDNIVQHYVNSVSYYTNYKYKVKVYSGRWYAMNRLGVISKKHVDWVAEYNSTCKYDGAYSMWQYTSKGSVPGIEGNVDISYIL